LKIPAIPHIIVIVLKDLCFYDNNFTVHLKYSSIFTAGIHVAAMTYTMGREPSRGSIACPFALTLLLKSSRFFILFGFII